jgi:ankyrin repeat protein
VPASNRPAPRETDDVLSSVDVIRMLLDKGANVNAALRAQIPYRTKLDRGGDGVLGVGTTPLLRAAKAGDTAVIKLLLEKGANPRAVTRNGVDGIMMAAGVASREEDMTGRSKTQKDAVETITLLTAAGADLSGADTQGRTALHGAALWGFNDVIRLLHQKGANINAADKRGLHPLDSAMGAAGGFGFDGTSGVVRTDTAALIKELGGVRGKLIPQAPGGGRGGRGGGAAPAADPQDGN